MADIRVCPACQGHPSNEDSPIHQNDIRQRCRDFDWGADFGN